MDEKEPEECAPGQEGMQRRDEDDFWEECMAVYDGVTGAVVRYEWVPMPEESWWERR